MKKSHLLGRCKAVWTIVTPFQQKREKSVVRFCLVSEQAHTSLSFWLSLHSGSISVLSVSSTSHTSFQKLKELWLGKDSPGPSQHLQSTSAGMQGDLRAQGGVELFKAFAGGTFVSCCTAAAMGWQLGKGEKTLFLAIEPHVLTCWESPNRRCC